MAELLLVDDEPTLLLSVGDRLEDAGHRVTRATDGQDAVQHLDQRVFDVVITDIRMPRLDGLALLSEVKRRSPGTDVVLMTAHAAVDDAVAALKDGARDYVTKPFDVDELLVRIDRLAEAHELKRELSQARAALAAREHVREIVGASPPMVRLNERIETLAPTDAAVLIRGESGTGKELVARRLHALSERRAGPFVPVHCAAFPETLIETELFGHERGAFTGAVRKRQGRFEAATGGTLFLDEVAEIPLPVQAKLLRVVQDGIVEPIGTNTSVRVDVRVLSATHRDLKACVRAGTFREDLYYRLNVLDVMVPPLRERRADLPLLVEHFLRRFAPKFDPPPGFAPAAWAALGEHAFPGNVRELEHAVQHAVVLSRGGEIQLEHLPRDIVGDVEAGAAGAGRGAGLRPLAQAIKGFEREYLLRALRAADGKKTRAAEMLGISRKNLWEKLKGHGIRDRDFKE